MYTFCTIFDYFGPLPAQEKLANYKVEDET
jgi:hypothetical protein